MYIQYFKNNALAVIKVSVAPGNGLGEGFAVSYQSDDGTETYYNIDSIGTIVCGTGYITVEANVSSLSITTNKEVTTCQN